MAGRPTGSGKNTRGTRRNPARMGTRKIGARGGKRRSAIKRAITDRQTARGYCKNKKESRDKKNTIKRKNQIKNRPNFGSVFLFTH